MCSTFNEEGNIDTAAPEAKASQQERVNKA